MPGVAGLPSHSAPTVSLCRSIGSIRQHGSIISTALGSAPSMADGNEVAGIRLPPIAVPLGTYTGWNVYRAQPCELCDRDGSSIPFPPNKARARSHQRPAPFAHSRSTILGGSAVFEGARALLEKIRRSAAARLDGSANEIELVDGRARISGGRSVSLAELSADGLRVDTAFANNN